MPEGDTILRTARTLAAVIAGKRVTRLASTLPAIARAGLASCVVAAVEAHGKNLLIRFDDGRVLHTHMRMNGSWHVYRPGERWKRPEWQARIVLEVEGAVAVCFSAPVVRLLRSDLGDRTLGALGPDVLEPAFDVDESVRRLRARGDEPMGDALVAQQAVAGVGNIWKSETLFACGANPFASVSTFSEESLRKILCEARRLMSASVRGAERPRPHVYRRSGEPCFTCGTMIKMRRQKDLRSTYFCPRCQDTS